MIFDNLGAQIDGEFIPMTWMEIVQMRIVPPVAPTQTPAPAPTSPDPKKAESEAIGRAIRVPRGDDRRMGAAHWMDQGDE